MGDRRGKNGLFRERIGGGSLIAASNDGGRGVCSSLEVSKNFKFSYSSRATPIRHRLVGLLYGLRMPRMYGGTRDESASIAIAVTAQHDDVVREAQR